MTRRAARRSAQPVKSYLVIMSRKRLGGSVPVFQFIAQPDEPTVNFIAGCVLDAMADVSGAEYDYTITPALIGSAQEGFTHVLRAAREAADQ
jgi:hypothetical protein